jgi:hypothetical protein
VRVDRWPVLGVVARAAGPGGVSAAVPEAGFVADEDLVGAEAVPVRAPSRWVGDPLPARGLHQLAQHSQKVNLAPTRQWGQRHIATGPTNRQRGVSTDARTFTRSDHSGIHRPRNQNPQAPRSLSKYGSTRCPCQLKG